MTPTTAPRASGVTHPRVLTLGPRVAVVVRPRPVVVAITFVAVTLLAGLVTLAVGELGIPVGELPRVLAGEGSRAQEWVLFTSRAPRLGVAALAGASFGVAGAIFQSVTRNPLGSPDVIGVNWGASAGAALVALAFPGTVPVPLGALLGAVAAVLTVATVTGTGLRHPGRLVVAGIGVAAMSAAFTQFVVAALARDQASVLAAYVNGTLSARSWEHAATIWLVVALAVPLLAALAQPVALTEMGDELADSLGARATRTRTAAITLSVVLAAGAVSVAGPIAFVSLTAPQIARRLTRLAGPNLVVSALVGALILALADLAVQHFPFTDGLPVGIATLAVGGIYLGFLLVREWRRGAL